MFFLILNLQKLEHLLEIHYQTKQFLETTRDKDPKRFQKIEKDNKLWIDFRLNADGPIDPKALLASHLSNDAESPSNRD